MLLDLVLLTSKYLTFISSFAVVGCLLAMSFLLLNVEGNLSESALALRRKASIVGLIWFIASATYIAATLADILGSSFTDALEITSLRSFVTQVLLGKYLFAQTIVAFVVGFLLLRVKRVIPTIFLLLISLVAIAAPALESHSASGGSHALATGSMILHIIGLSLWVGGLFALAFIKNEERKPAILRFSVMALWAAIIVVASGLINAWARLNFKAAWDTTYARVVILKTVLTAILILIGYLHRKKIALRPAIDWRGITRLVTGEVVLMAAITAIGIWLSVNASPERIIDPVIPEAPTLSRILWAYEPDLFFIGALVLTTALYIKGVVILKKRGDTWPVGRTVAFALGITGIDFATSGGLGVYAMYSFEYHMVAHMTLGMIAPIGLVLGAPVTLALRTLPQGRTPEERGPRAVLVALLHSRYGILLTNPVIALALFDGSLFVLYFTDLFGTLMSNHAGHLLMNIHFILAGFLFFMIVIGVDPSPRRIHHLVRIVILFAAMAIHAFFSIALLATTSLIDKGFYSSQNIPWLGSGLLDDQRAGGSWSWAMGEIPIILALIATFILWMREDAKETRRIDRNEERKAAMGEPDELAQYNAYLQSLNTREEK
ncbi:MAG: cytochrome c oxidase assembly protein [Candidatus Planktophila sp.]